MPKRPCLEPGCAEFAAPKGRGRCQRHAREQDKSINRQGREIYGSRKWQYTRRKKLTLNPACEWKGGCTALSEDVHHKHGVEADPWSMDGLEALCKVHHGQITRAAQLVGVADDL